MVFVLRLCEIPRSTYYRYFRPRTTTSSFAIRGRPIPGYTINRDGTIIIDFIIVHLLKSYRQSLNYLNAGGFKVLMHLLRRDYNFYINHKKIYRLCLINKLLLPKNKKKIKANRKVSQNRKINAPNKLWQFDIKADYIQGENKHFYFLSIIDVFNREVKGHHIGYSCKASDLKITIERAVKEHSPNVNDLVIRSDNGPQMTSNQLYHYLEEVGLEQGFIPVRCPNKNAYIESFFSIYESHFLQVRYFRSLKEVYDQTDEFIRFYNENRLHSSLGYRSPKEFTDLFERRKIDFKIVSC